MKPKQRWGTEESRAYLFFVLPAVLIYWAVTAFPFIFSIALSLTDYGGGRLFCADTPLHFVGLSHYSFMFNDRYFWLAFRNNFLIILISIFGQIPLGFILAYLLHRKLVRCPGFFQSVIYLPTILPAVVVGILWQSFFNPYGPFTEIVQRFIPGWENNLFLDFKTAMPPVLFVILWMYTGNYLIIFLANLQKIEPELMEAAKIDGASEGQIMRYVILPILSGVIAVSAILAITGSLNSFSLIWAMTQGNPARMTSVLSIYMYHTAFTGAPNYPLANAISTFIVCTSLLLVLITKVLEKRLGGES
ncbi:MAG: sugar ABC transporter permease [Firmicutes bacterium]|nr:sugar ABC transporter permease [Bacillota bacterium]